MLLPLMLEKRDSSFEAANTGAHIKFDNDMIPYTSAYSRCVFHPIASFLLWCCLCLSLSFPCFCSYLGVTANKMPFNDVTVMDWERELIKLELRRHIGSSVITLWNATIPLSFFHVEPAVNGRCSYGQYMDGACSLAFVLQSLCFVVDPENNFQLDTTRGEGCIVTDRFQRGADPLRTGATSASNGFLSSRHYYPYFPTNLPASWSWASKAMTIYVRSTKDPFVHALRMTQGTLDFGKSRQYYISIALCLIIASAFLFLIVFYSAKLYIARQKSRHQPDPTSSVVQNPLGVFRANIHDRNPEPSSEDPVNEVELSSRRVVWTRANGRN